MLHGERQAIDYGEYRDYLLVLAQMQVNPRERGKIDLSGVVQQTLLEAHQSADQLRGERDEQRLAWLRRILSHNLQDEFRKWRSAKRDVSRECALDDDLAKSSARLANWLCSDVPTASQIVQDEERAVRLARALQTLPAAQREALVLQHWHGYSLAEIASQMDRTTAAVAGLLKRGLRQLREVMID